MTAPATPSGLATVGTLAQVTLKRFTRGRGPWIAAGLAAPPVVYATVRHVYHGAARASELFFLTMLLVAVLPAMFIASSIGEEIEQRTSAYLWSRALPRWAVIAGVLSALAPFAVVLMVASWIAAVRLGTVSGPSAVSCIAVAAACLAASFVAAGIATLVPRHAMVLTICYLLADNTIGALDFSLAELSITHQAKLLAQFADEPQPIAGPLIAIALVAAVWGAIAAVRIRRLEV